MASSLSCSASVLALLVPRVDVGQSLHARVGESAPTLILLIAIAATCVVALILDAQSRMRAG